MDNPITVQVALRIRPLVETETVRGCQNTLDVISNEAQVVIRGTEKAFTYNYVFGPDDSQEIFYDNAVKEMVKNVFKGYNVTVLAYGQTGSGKTYSMGTNFDGQEINDNNTGIIPRAIWDIFSAITEKTNYEFKVTVSFMELYKEQLYDLLAPVRSTVDIREEGKVIKIPGLTEVPVVNFQETVKCLTQGSLGRATGATAMNAQSSRSHAIFTLTVHQQEKNNVDSATSAKFHLVDLAGSERPKKTQATGERFKEGVNINRGLLALGNVISALGDEQQRGYISYRDSKLTRLLQDSLGGNSLTLMIACVSPADYNLEETLSTLRYADRARNIKNKPIVNVDAKVAEIAKLKLEVQQLKLELNSQNGSGFNYHESLKLKEENEILTTKNRKLTQALNEMFNENTNLVERALLAETARDKMKIKLCELQAQYGNAVETLNQTLDPHTCPASFYEQLQTLKELQLKIQDLQADQKRTEEEILNHEISNNNRSGGPGSDEYDEKSHSTHHKDLDEHHEAYTFQQAALSKELQELNKALALKEELATQLKLNANQISNINSEFVENMKDLEQQVSFLQQEKDELLQALKTAQSNTSCKLGDQRRSKLQELEQKISALNKKIAEQSKVIKMKEKSEEKITALCNEIKNMKSNKVRLIKQMRAENERFRLWKLQKERELVKLRDQDRRHQFQLNRMERLHSKQQNVLRRKVEEASAINKRLKDALALQKSAQERRALNGNSAVKIQQWVEQELEVLVSTLVAERTIEQLLEDRSLLSQQLKQLQNNVEEESLSLKDKEEIEEEIKQLNEDISLRNTQISDLQQKLIDADKENKAKHRWETVQSMNDAKCALKYLFELVADMKTLKDFKLEEIQTAHSKALETLQNYEQQLKQVAQEHQQEVILLEKEHQDKIFVLLQQLQKSSNGELVGSDVTERLKIQECELQKMESLRNELETKQAEIEQLKQQLNKPKRIRKTNIFEQEDIFIDFDLESEEEENGNNDDPNDPDWQKTPLYKRLSKLKKKRQPSLEDNSRIDVDKENITENPKGIKRSSDGETMCSCMGKCARCACKKMGEFCTSMCKCRADICVNRCQKNSTGRVLFTDEESTEDDDSFKRPRALSENTYVATPQPQKKKVRYFQGN